MTTLDKDGMLVDPKVMIRRFTSIEHGRLLAVKAIVVHQTDAPTTQATFNAYAAGGNGAHFLLDKDGTIYQTASMYSRCYHVGKLIRSKCLEITPATCKDPALAKALTLKWSAQVSAIDSRERTKSYPDRFPTNSDSVGIELVGKSTGPKSYEAVTASQQVSLQWLIDQVYVLFSLGKSDVYRHPEVSYKNPGEAATASWK
jgi:N-acetyl-anhydromuramyl-L-alanine amidase AmpD